MLLTDIADKLSVLFEKALPTRSGHNANNLCESAARIQVADGNYMYEPAHVSSKSSGITTKRVCPAAAINLTSPKDVFCSIGSMQRRRRKRALPLKDVTRAARMLVTFNENARRE